MHLKLGGMSIDMTENYKQAPLLVHNGFKQRFGNRNYYELPQELMRTVFNRLSGKHGNQLKLLIVLMGTAGNRGFRVSQKWITDLTGMDESGYKRARKALTDMGWITHENGYIAVNFDAIWAAAHDASPSGVTPDGDMTPRASSTQGGSMTALRDAPAGVIRNTAPASDFNGEASNPSGGAMTSRIINNNKEEQIIYKKEEGGQSPGEEKTGPRDLIHPIKKNRRKPELLKIEDYLED